MRNDNNSIAVWSAKGGSGASTVAALLARSLAHTSPQGAVLVDLCDDAGDILGLTPTGETPSTGPVHGAPSGRLFLQDRAGALAGVAAEAARPGVAVIVDAGCLWRAGGATAGGRGAGDQPDDLDARSDAVDGSGRSWLVTRACLLSLRRATLSGRRPDGVVLLKEPGRVIAVADIEAVVKAPVILTLNVGDKIANAVAGGLASARIPPDVERALRIATQAHVAPVPDRIGLAP